MKMEESRGQIKRTNENPPLRTGDDELLQELSVFAVYMRGNKIGILQVSKELKSLGTELIEYLQMGIT